MLRIVGIKRSETPDLEFVLLQNQGSIRVKLKGHAIVEESKSEEAGPAMYLFAETECIPPGNFVLLKSGIGESKWGLSKDGSRVYFTYAGGNQTLWSCLEGSLHLLGTQHTFVERKDRATILSS